MPIHYTIVKLAHASELDVDELKPYIKDADIVFPEQTNQTTERTKEIEASHRDILINNRRRLENVFGLMKAATSLTDSPRYNTFLNAFLFEQQKPKLFLERIPLGNHPVDEEVRMFLLHGNIPLAMQFQYQESICWVNQTRTRDVHMVETMATIEGRIEELYPHVGKRLRNKETLQGLMPIGAAHRPEIMMRKKGIPYAIVTLDTSIERVRSSGAALGIQMYKDDLTRRSDAYTQLLVATLLEKAIFLTYEKIYSPGLTSLPYHIVQGMGIDHLNDLGKYLRKAPDEGKVKAIRQYFADQGKPLPRS